MGLVSKFVLNQRKDFLYLPLTAHHLKSVISNVEFQTNLGLPKPHHPIFSKISQRLLSGALVCKILVVALASPPLKAGFSDFNCIVFVKFF